MVADEDIAENIAVAVAVAPVVVGTVVVAETVGAYLTVANLAAAYLPGRQRQLCFVGELVAIAELSVATVVQTVRRPKTLLYFVVPAIAVAAVVAAVLMKQYYDSERE
jgi:hypothetical protein